MKGNGEYAIIGHQGCVFMAKLLWWGLMRYFRMYEGGIDFLMTTSYGISVD